jgi:pimeloyl-ACP methyl ester carboxylesterase
MWFLLIIIIFVIILLAIGIVPTKCIYDYDSPLNLFMFQEPNNKYSDQLVNLWIDKSWRSDGRRIPCRIEYGYKYDTPNRERKLIVYSHGNAEDLLNCSQFIRELSESLDMDVVCWDYSGYGLNDIDRFERTPEGINLSLQTLIDHMVRQKGYDLSNIILWGYSLGTGPSTHIAASLSQRQTPPAGLILFGAYSSILDVVKDVTKQDLSKIFSERWNTKEIIGQVTIPILMMHGQSDGLIKPSHADILHTRNPKAKLVKMPLSGHTTMNYAECIKEVKRWMIEKNIAQF